MRVTPALVCVLFFFTFFGTAYAFYDDSVVMEIGDLVPQASSTDNSPASGTPQGGGSDSTDSTAGNPAAELNNGGAGGAANTSPGAVSPGADNNAGGGTSGGVNNPPPPEHITTSNELFDVLVAAGAITGNQSGVSGGQNQNAQNASGSGSNTGAGGTSGSNGPNSGTVPDGGNTGAGATGGGGGVITINAAKVRTTFRDKVSFWEILDASVSFTRGVHGKTSSDRDLGLTAASTVLRDSNIEEISFTATRFEIVYSSLGYLFAFIPITFPVHIAVNPQATSLNERVAIGLPWYSFFLQRFFSNASLAQEIETVIETNGVPQEGDSAADVQQRLFAAVSLVIQKNVGTMDDAAMGI